MTLGDWGRRVSAAMGAALFIVLLLSLARVDYVPTYLTAAVIALAVVAASRPQTALLAMGAIVPVAWWLGRRWQPSASWAEVLVVAFAAGYCARRAMGAQDARTSLDRPLFLSAIVVSASLSVQLLADAWRIGGDAMRAHLWQLLTRDYFVSSTGADPIDVAMRLLESLLLLRAAASVTGSAPAFPARFARWFVSGAALAAAINILRLWEGAVRLDAPVAAFARYLMTLRMNVHYGDLNAAGSYFVMALFPAIALVLLPKGKRWMSAAVLVAAGAWIAGSRAAFVSGLLATTLPVCLLVWRSSRRPSTAALAATAVVLALAAGATAYYLPHRGNQQSMLTALQVRLELTRTSARMLASRPAFGVGIGQYQARSGEFSSPTLLTLFPPARHENAHNNFLQILAELGIVGFAAFGWVLWTAGTRCLRLLRENARDPLRLGVVTGLLSFVISWLGGHPLLIDEPAFMFWLLLGVASGWGERPGVSIPSVWRSWWVVAALVVVTAASVPLRGYQERANVDLEHRGIGLSEWQDAIDGVRYRLAGGTSSVFVPSGAQWITVPLRAVKAGADLSVQLQLDGRTVDVVKVPPDSWRSLRLILPRDRHPPRFRRLDLRVAGASSADGPLLRIGKVEPH